ncbi:MAG: D-hexose-6-phosphate mutarotase [Gammaproteobacteria bacterium]|nr:D-hexose-6-phosphate mutarotase [Gammaproteobacteria bacterium]
MSIENLSHLPFCTWHTRGPLASLRIEHPLFSAEILRQGAQLIHFAPRHQTSWVWLSETALFERGVSVRGGIPLCWPWFGQPARNPDAVRANMLKPGAHGFARSMDWQLDQCHIRAHGVDLTFRLESNAHTHTHWPHDFVLEARFQLGKTLQLELTTRNTGHRAFTFTQALHTYLPTQDIHQTRIDGFSGRPYVDTLLHWQTRHQAGPIRFQGETDRIYDAGLRQTLYTPDRILHLSPHGSATTVIWNPWIRKAKTLSGFAPDAWQRMLCVETANALDDAVTLAPGEDFTLGMTLTAEQR